VELFGRENDLAEVAARLMGGHRLVTVTGPGGVGKTSVARAVMARLEPAFALGGHLVDLSRIDRPDAVAGELAAQLGFSSFDNLLGSPTDQPALMVVDNCEHVIEAAADALDLLLGHCASPVVLATSRSPLNLPGESVVVLGPLDVPAAGAGHADAGEASAVRLFRDRAQHAGAAVAESDVAAVGELCRRLDGLPLAIEIAAARTRTLGVAGLVERLAGGIDVLHRPRYRGSGRHRSLRDTIEWSYGLLEADSRVAFDRLGVCAGPFSLDLAAAVAVDDPATALDVIERLVEASLVVVDRSARVTRYRLLDTIRAVALDHLTAHGALDGARARFAGHVLAVVTPLIEVARWRWEADLLPTLLDLFDHIDAALRYFVEVDAEPEAAFTLYTVLWGAVHQARVDEVVELGRLVASRWPAVDHPAGADAVATLAMGTLLCGDAREATALATAALVHADAGVYAPATLRRVLAFAARAEGDRDRAAAMLDEATRAAARHGVPTMEMECIVFRAQDVAASGRPDEALDDVRAVAEQARTAGSILNEVWARTVEGAIVAADDPEAARSLVEATLATADAIDYPFGTTCNLQTLTTCLLACGSVAEAATVVLRLLDAVGRSGAGDYRVALEHAGAVARAAGRAEAADLLATAATLPNTNPMTLGRPSPAVPAAGRVLERADAVRLARRLLTDSASIHSDGTVDVTEMHATGAKPSRRPEGAFVRNGDVWELTYAGATVHVRTAKGVEDLAVLLVRPGTDVHCLDLAGAGVKEPATGEVIDATARRRYEARVRELQAEIDDADAAHDVGRSERARLELDALVDHLTAALGLAGKARQEGGTAARARSAVTHRIRASIRRIGELHPALGRHLDASVTTGTYCSYRPEHPVQWRM
jgi:predicted ATPase